MFAIFGEGMVGLRLALGIDASSTLFEVGSAGCAPCNTQQPSPTPPLTNMWWQCCRVVDRDQGGCIVGPVWPHVHDASNATQHSGEKKAFRRAGG